MKKDEEQEKNLNVECKKVPCGEKLMK